jgi:hypothetical protein
LVVVMVVELFCGVEGWAIWMEGMSLASVWQFGLLTTLVFGEQERHLTSSTPSFLHTCEIYTPTHRNFNPSTTPIPFTIESQ